jgi:hypothetical protein
MKTNFNYYDPTAGQRVNIHWTPFGRTRRLATRFSFAKNVVTGTDRPLKQRLHGALRYSILEGADPKLVEKYQSMADDLEEEQKEPSLT